MFKFRLFIDFDKEEQWLNEMARGGFQLENVSLGYSFRPSPPEDSRFRIDHRVFNTQSEFVNYCTLFEDSGWKHIAGTRNTGVQYFKRLSERSAEDIFSDELSKAERYKRVSRFWLFFAVGMFFFSLVLVLTGGVDFRAMVNPRLFYLTPGLWNRSGDSFWRAFWFETPFALFRAALLYFYPAAILIYLGFAIKSRSLYKKGNKDLPR